MSEELKEGDVIELNELHNVLYPHRPNFINTEADKEPTFCQVSLNLEYYGFLHGRYVVEKTEFEADFNLILNQTLIYCRSLENSDVELRFFESEGQEPLNIGIKPIGRAERTASRWRIVETY